MYLVDRLQANDLQADFSEFTELAESPARAVARQNPGYAISDAAGQLLGLVLVCLVSAAFWTCLAAGIAPLLGLEISTYTLTLMALSIASFLAVTCGGLMLKPR